VRRQAERSGVGGIGGFPRLRQTNSHPRRRRPSRAQRPSRAPRRRGIRGSSPAAAVQLARTPKKTRPSAAARPSAAEKGGFGGHPRLRQSNSLARRRKPSRAQRLGRAPRRRGIRGSSPAAAVQLARTPKKTMPSAAARPSAAEKGGFGGHPRLRQSNSLARRRKPSRAQRPGRAQRRRGDLGASPDYGNPTSTHAEKGKRSGEGEF
jgi:hypothetical protein